MNIDIRLIPKKDIKTILPLLKACDPLNSEDILKMRLDDMMQHNYKCVGVYDADKLIGISGLWMLNKYYVGKHLEPDNVYLLPAYQKKGLGQKLMEWIYAYAKEQGCAAIELNCYANNKTGQKFWKSQGFSPIGVHYQKKF